MLLYISLNVLISRIFCYIKLDILDLNKEVIKLALSLKIDFLVKHTFEILHINLILVNN